MPVNTLNKLCLLLGILVLGFSVRLALKQYSTWQYHSEYWTKLSWETILHIVCSLTAIFLGLLRLTFQNTPKLDNNSTEMQQPQAELKLPEDNDKETNC